MADPDYAAYIERKLSFVAPTGLRQDILQEVQDRLASAAAASAGEGGESAVSGELSRALQRHDLEEAARDRSKAFAAPDGHYIERRGGVIVTAMRSDRENDASLAA